MKRNYYIFSNGRLRRKQNTIWLETGEDKKVVPIEDCEAFYAFAELDLNTKLLNFLGQNKIPIHFFNYYGFYSGSFMPRDYLVSGQLLVKQVSHYQQKKKRLELARAFVDGASFNILKNLRYYAGRGRDLTGLIDDIEAYRQTIPGATDIPQLMGIEGNIRQTYYGGFEQIMEMPFETRTKRPPQNELNALVSFCNTLVYTTCLGELYRTQLNPTISFLHEPGSRRFSLCLDLAEIFKPILADRMIFSLVNRKQIQAQHFDSELEGCYLKEAGRKIVLQEYNNRLETTIKHRRLNRHVSYRRLVRLEAYKLIKHLMDDEQFKPFKIWW